MGKRDMRVDVQYEGKWFHTMVSSKQFNHAINHINTRGYGYLPSTSQDYLCIQVREALKLSHRVIWDDFKIVVCDAFDDPGCHVDGTKK